MIAAGSGSEEVGVVCRIPSWALGGWKRDRRAHWLHVPQCPTSPAGRIGTGLPRPNHPNLRRIFGTSKRPASGGKEVVLVLGLAVTTISQDPTPCSEGNLALMAVDALQRHPDRLCMGSLRSASSYQPLWACSVPGVLDQNADDPSLSNGAPLTFVGTLKAPRQGVPSQAAGVGSLSQSMLLVKGF